MTMLNKGLKPVLYDKDKAVSPIIATILLVAITVILASTLYLALGGFFSHVGTTTPSASISVSGNTTSTTTTSTAGNDITTYTVTVGSPSATVPWTSTAFSVTLNNGQSATLSPTNTYDASISPSGTTVAITTVPSSGNVAVTTFTLTITTPGSTTAPVYLYLTSISFLDTASSGGGVMGSTSTIG